MKLTAGQVIENAKWPAVRISFLKGIEDKVYCMIIHFSSIKNDCKIIFECSPIYNLIPNCHVAHILGLVSLITVTISFPESTLPLSSGAGNERLWDKAFLDVKIFVMRFNAHA